MTFALIPAAGHSRRMGRPKLALPVAGQPLIVHVVRGLRAGGIDDVLVVLGPHVTDLASPAAGAGATVLVLPEPTPDMRATVEAGLAWLEAERHPSPEDDWLMMPADHPTLEAAVVRALLDARRQYPVHSIIVPTWQGKRGHPTLIRWRHVAGLRAHPAEEGLNRYLRLHAHDTLEVDLPYPAVIEDLDTPEDYEQLVQRGGGQP